MYARKQTLLLCVLCVQDIQQGRIKYIICVSMNTDNEMPTTNTEYIILIDFTTKKDEVRICSGKLRILSPPPTPTVARVQVGVGASHAILCLISR